MRLTSAIDTGESVVIWSRDAFGQTKYVLLTDAVERWRHRQNEEVTYVTFNYDLMLEVALSAFKSSSPSTITSTDQRSC